MTGDARLLCSSASITTVRRRARPSTRAALNPAAPAPTTAHSHLRHRAY